MSVEVFTILLVVVWITGIFFLAGLFNIKDEDERIILIMMWPFIPVLIIMCGTGAILTLPFLLLYLLGINVRKMFGYATN